MNSSIILTIVCGVCGAYRNTHIYIKRHVVFSCVFVRVFKITAAHCNILQHTTEHCSTLQHTAAHCSTLQHTATHYSTLQHTAAHCSTLQHTAAHCSTLQHTATHCSTHCVFEDKSVAGISTSSSRTLGVCVAHCRVYMYM